MLGFYRFSIKSFLLCLITLIPIYSKADISITGATSFVTSVSSSTSFEFMESSSSAQFVSFDTYTTSDSESITSNSHFYTLPGNNKFTNMDRDLFIIPALLVNLIPGGMYFDISTSNTNSNYKTLSIPPCCSSITPNLLRKPTIDSDKSLSLLFNKKIKDSGYYLTGSYQNIKSSRQSIFPTKEDLMIGCVSCVNMVDRDEMTEKYSRLGLGFEKLINSNYSLYAQIAYTQIYLEYIVNSSTLDFPFPKLSQNYEGSVNTYGIKVYPFKDFMVDINKDIFNLNGVSAPDKSSINFLHKINKNLSMGLGYSDSKYIDTYSEVKSSEKSLIFRIEF